MDKAFIPEDLITPPLLQRLFKKQVKENAIIEVNNLLASKPLREITPDEVAEIAMRYDVDLQGEYPDQLREFYERYLTKCLEDNALSDEEFDDLTYLRSLLLLEEHDVADIHEALAGAIYKTSYDEALNSGAVGTEKAAFLDKLKQSLHLPEELVQKITAESNTLFTDAQFEKIGEDERISPAEWDELTALTKSLGVNIKKYEINNSTLVKMKLFWVIENGEIPTIEAGINLQKDERCFYSSPADWIESRTVTKAIKYTVRSTSFKYADGVRKTSGTRSSERITAEEMTIIDSGTIYVTSKRIIFVGAKSNSTILLSNILSITPYKNGIGLEKDSGKSPILSVGSTGDIMCAIVIRVLKDIQNGA